MASKIIILRVESGYISMLLEEVMMPSKIRVLLRRNREVLQILGEQPMFKYVGGGEAILSSAAVNPDVVWVSRTRK